MLVVGLLSGGKDSVYNLLHCVINGHQPVALASLGPPDGKGQTQLIRSPAPHKHHADPTACIDR